MVGEKIGIISLGGNLVIIKFSRFSMKDTDLKSYMSFHIKTHNANVTLTTYISFSLFIAIFIYISTRSPVHEIVWPHPPVCTPPIHLPPLACLLVSSVLVIPCIQNDYQRPFMTQTRDPMRDIHARASALAVVACLPQPSQP